jgi:hypothetical protein
MAEICGVESENERKKEQFVAFLTDCEIHKSFRYTPDTERVPKQTENNKKVT